MGSPKHTTDLDRDYTIPQDWERYTDAEHEMWRRLYRRQAEMLPGRAAEAFMDGLTKLDLNEGGIPDFRRLNEKLHGLTGWTVEAVPDLVPDAAFFRMLAGRRFPASASPKRWTTSKSPTCSTTSSATCPCSPIRRSPISWRPTARGACAPSSSAPSIIWPGSIGTRWSSA